MTTCQHCGLPDKALWRTKCRYTWWLPYKDEFIESGADRPCYLDALAEDDEADKAAYLQMLEDQDRRARGFARMAVLGILAIIGIWLFCMRMGK